MHFSSFGMTINSHAIVKEITCEYFYLAAKKFSRNTLKLAEIGLFDLTEMKVIKTPEYLYPDVELRANIMKRIKNNFKVLTNAVDDPFQRTIPEF